MFFIEFIVCSDVELLCIILRVVSNVFSTPITNMWGKEY